MPTDNATKEEWLRAIPRAVTNWTKFSRVCSKHFSDECFSGDYKWRRLHPSAVPTLNMENITLPIDVHEIRKSLSPIYNKTLTIRIYQLEQAMKKRDRLLQKRLLKINALRQKIKRLKYKDKSLDDRLQETRKIFNKDNMETGVTASLSPDRLPLELDYQLDQALSFTKDESYEFQEQIGLAQIEMIQSSEERNISKSDTATSQGDDDKDDDDKDNDSDVIHNARIEDIFKGASVSSDNSAPHIKPLVIDSGDITNTVEKQAEINDGIFKENLESTTIIYRVYNYMRKEYEYLKGLNRGELDLNPLRRTTEATGVSIETVTAILLLKELDNDLQNERISLEHNYHLERAREKDPLQSKSKKINKNVGINKELASTSILDMKSEKLKKSNTAKPDVKTTKRKRKNRRWTRQKHKTVKIQSNLNISTPNLSKKRKKSRKIADAEMTDSDADSRIADEYDSRSRNGRLRRTRNKPFRYKTSVEQYRDSISSTSMEWNPFSVVYMPNTPNKPIRHNRHIVEYREEDEDSIENGEDDMQSCSIDNKDDMPGLVLKCEVFEDGVNKVHAVSNHWPPNANVEIKSEPEDICMDL